MVKSGWTSVALKDALVAEIDEFLSTRPMGFSNRAELVTAAVRAFLAEPTSVVNVDRRLREIFTEAARRDPRTVGELVAIVLAEVSDQPIEPARRERKMEPRP